MNVFYKSVLMFLGSSTGLSLVYILIYTIYVVKKTGKYIYLLWILFPIIPVIYFFLNEKTKKTWIIFIFMMLFYLFFVSNLEPNIIKEKIIDVSFNYANKQYFVTQNIQPRLITSIKWEIYKVELLRNLGIETKKSYYSGELEIHVRNGIIIKHNFPLKKIIAIVEEI